MTLRADASTRLVTLLIPREANQGRYRTSVGCRSVPLSKTKQLLWWASAGDSERHTDVEAVRIDGWVQAV